MSNYSIVGVGYAISEVCQATNDQHDVTVAQSAGYEHINWIVIDAMMVMCGLWQRVFGSFCVYIQKDVCKANCIFFQDSMCPILYSTL